MRRAISDWSRHPGVIALGVVLTCVVFAMSQPGGYPSPNVVLVDISLTQVDAYCHYSYDDGTTHETTDDPDPVTQVPLDDGFIELTASIVNSFLNSGYTAEVQSNDRQVKTVHTTGEFYATYDSQHPFTVHFHDGGATADDTYVVDTNIAACGQQWRPPPSFIHYTYFEIDVSVMNVISDFEVTLHVESNYAGDTLDIANDGSGTTGSYSDINNGTVAANNLYSGVSSFWTGSGDIVSQFSHLGASHAGVPIFLMMPPTSYTEAGGGGFGTLVSWVFDPGC